MPSFIENVNILATQVAPKANQILQAGTDAVNALAANEAIKDEIKITYEASKILDIKRAAVEAKVDNFNATFDSRLQEVQTVYDETQEDLNAIDDKLVDLNSSVNAAIVLKHDMEAAAVAANDINSLLISTIGNAGNAQVALDYKVAENKNALDDIANDAIILLEQKANNAGNLIDLKIAMANEARNSLSVIEQSVTLAQTAASNAQTAAATAKNATDIINTVLSETDEKIEILVSTLESINIALPQIETKATTAFEINTTLNTTMSSASSANSSLSQNIQIFSNLNVQELTNEAKNQADRLASTVPAAQNLSANTEAAVIANTNLLQLITLGNTLKNSLSAENAAASAYLEQVTALINETVVAKVNEVIATVADEKIAFMVQVASENEEALNSISDVDISGLEE